MTEKQGKEEKSIRGGMSLRATLEILSAAILALYPLRHVNWGLDLWDVGYNYANFKYMGTEHMDPMWLFSTYLSTAVGHLITKLPGAGGLVGMNFFTSLFASILALLGYWFCVKKLRMPFGIAFLGEMLALSLCWCPGAVLYNYLTYLLFLGGVILLYLGLTGEKKGYLAAAGVCLGVNVLTRFSNLPEMGMILAVWAYDLIVWQEEGRKKKGFLPVTLRHTGWCVLGYGGALAASGVYLQARYGLGAYFAGIGRLFAMTDTATDYKATAMIRSVVDYYVKNLYWAVRIGVILSAGLLAFAVLGFLREILAGKKKILRCLSCAVHLFSAALGAAMLIWLYRRKFCSLQFSDYNAMLLPGILFLMLTMLIAAVRIFSRGSAREEKLISGMVILVILLSSLGSNTGVFSSLNNLFVAAPYTLWESWRFVRRARETKIAHVTLNPFPAKCILTAFLLMCFFQFGAFGAVFCFAEATGIQDISASVENNEILRNVRMSEEKARWITELSGYVEENGLQGQEVILYGYIPALSYYLQMPSAFNPWSDLDSYSQEVMEESLKALHDETPVIILESSCAAYPEQADGKLLLLFEFMREHGYKQTFRNEKFVVYR
ncbi:MAG: hypothetical protein NC541_05690 [bacterium]|nr:hypothetical protein [bacterium]